MESSSAVLKDINKVSEDGKKKTQEKKDLPAKKVDLDEVGCARDLNMVLTNVIFGILFVEHFSTFRFMCASYTSL